MFKTQPIHDLHADEQQALENLKNMYTEMDRRGEIRKPKIYFTPVLMKLAPYGLAGFIVYNVLNNASML